MPAVKPKVIGGDNVASIDPRKEYLTGGVLSTYGNNGTVLPDFDNNSSLTNIFGREHSVRTLYQMLEDPKICKDISILKIGVLGNEVEFLPAVPETDPSHEEAVKIAEFCGHALKELQLPLRYVLEQMMDALVFGHKIAEVTYKTSKVPTFNGTYLIPDKIKVKRIGVVQFVVDNKSNVIGLTSQAVDVAQRGNAAEPLKRTIGKDDKVYINGKPILPREKFMVLTIKGKDNDPRGQSLLIPAFSAWHLKTQIWPEYLKYLMLCSIPLLVGYTPENESPIKEIARKADGTPQTDPLTGAYLRATPEQALRDALLDARNSEVLAMKGGSKVQEIGGQGAGTAFFKAFELFDTQIETAILNQTLATSEGVHQSRAASLTQMSVLDQLIWWLKGVVADMLVADLLRPMVRFNFGDDALDLTPTVNLGDTERRDFAVDATAVATLYAAKYLQPEQLKQTDAMLGLMVRETVDPLDLIQQLQAAGVPIAAVPPPVEEVATVAAGAGGGSTPVPAPRTGATVPVGAGVTSQQSKAAANRKRVVKLPAVGRTSNKINASPKNPELK
jgi:hypothetical protein